eukprot:scaffold239160_cov32-Prasinocladus_malaysianus.AAC.1
MNENKLPLLIPCSTRSKQHKHASLRTHGRSEGPMSSYQTMRDEKTGFSSARLNTAARRH